MAESIVINDTGSRQSQKPEITYYHLNFVESQWHNPSWHLVTISPINSLSASNGLTGLAEGQGLHTTVKLTHVLRKFFFVTMTRNGKDVKEVMDEDSSR